MWSSHTKDRRRGRTIGWSELVQGQAGWLHHCRSQPSPHRAAAPGNGQCGVQDPGPQEHLHVRIHPECFDGPKRQSLQDPQGLHRLRQEEPSRRYDRRGERHLLGERSGNRHASTRAAGINDVRPPSGWLGSRRSLPFWENHVMALMSYSPMVVQYKEKFRFLAMASEKRMEIIPDVPTFRELGYDIVEGAYRGVAAPPGTPDEIIKVSRRRLRQDHEGPGGPEEDGSERLQDGVYGARGLPGLGEEEDGRIRKDPERTGPVSKSRNNDQNTSKGEKINHAYYRSEDRIVAYAPATADAVWVLQREKGVW